MVRHVVHDELADLAQHPVARVVVAEVDDVDGFEVREPGEVLVECVLWESLASSRITT